MMAIDLCRMFQTAGRAGPKYKTSQSVLDDPNSKACCDPYADIRVVVNLQPSKNIVADALQSAGRNKALGFWWRTWSRFAVEAVGQSNWRSLN